MLKYITLDKKVILPRVRGIQGLRLDWEPPAWRALKGFVHGDGVQVNWPRIYSAAKNARLTVPVSKKPLTREHHMHLKAMYTMLQEGYLIRDSAGRVATFRRAGWKGRITSGASTIVSSPFRRDDSHAAGIEKMRSYLQMPSVNFAIKPLGIAFRELTFENESFGPAYFWLLYEAVADCSLPSTKQPIPDEDSFVGMKDCESLLAGKTKVAGNMIQLGGAGDIAALKLIAGQRHQDPLCSIRRIQQGELDAIPEFKKPLIEERVQKKLALFGLLGSGSLLVWKLADHAGNAEWIFENLTKALVDLQSSF